MEKTAENAKQLTLGGKYKHLSKEKSDALKRYLGSNYYPEFVRRFQKAEGRGKKVPTINAVVSAANGRTNNQRIMKILLEIAEEGKALDAKLETLKDAAQSA